MSILASVSFSLKWNIITLTELLPGLNQYLALITEMSVICQTLNKLLSFLCDYHVTLTSAQ